MSDHLNPQFILKAFDEHLDKIDWRLKRTRDAIKDEAYRELVGSLTVDINFLKHLIEKYEHVFKSLGINPREQAAWVEHIKPESKDGDS